MFASMRLRILLIGSVVPLGLSGMNAAFANDALWARLAEGGKVVLMRHASVVSGRGGGNSLLRDPSCKKERNLSDDGKLEAKTLGERFRARSIPIEAVRHSPYCRTADTASIGFGGGSEAGYLSLLEVLGAAEAAAQTAELNKAIGSYAGKGTLVLVTHEPNINAVSFEMMKPADFLVLQPKGGSEFEELGVVRFNEAN
jgi:phosphohistidine phosphatase SixA